MTSPPYWGLRDYGTNPLVWGGEALCKHKWGGTVATKATNHTDKRRWNHTRNGRDEEQPKAKRVSWLRTAVDQGKFCTRCGAWSGHLGLEPTPDLFVRNLIEVFREVRRVLADDGTLWLNLGDCYATGAGKVGERPGGGKQGDRWSGYRGSHDGSPKHRSAIGPMTQPNRMPIAGLKPKDLVGMPWRVAFALQADGWYLRSDIVWHKPNAMPESVTDRPTRAHEYLFLLAKSERYYYDHEAIKEPAKDAMASRILGSGNKRRSYDMEHGRPGGHNAHGIPWKPTIEPERKALHGPTYERHRSRVPGGQDLRANPTYYRNRRTVWSIPTRPFKGAHFATFPPGLIEPCVLAGSRAGDTVLDPFFGAGTTGMVAEQLGRRFIGIELNPEYSSLAREPREELKDDEHELSTQHLRRPFDDHRLRGVGARMAAT